MKIKLSDFIDALSKKYFNGQRLQVTASYESIDMPSDIAKSDDEDMKRKYLVSAYRELPEESKFLHIDVSKRGKPIAQFMAYGINPSTNDIYKDMSLEIAVDCIGPGFYYYNGFLYIKNSSKDKETRQEYKKASDKIYIDDKHTETFLLDPKMSDFDLSELIREYLAGASSTV